VLSDSGRADHSSRGVPSNDCASNCLIGCDREAYIVNRSLTTRESRQKNKQIMIEGLLIIAVRVITAGPIGRAV
jgi:hypothetical protein